MARPTVIIFAMEGSDEYGAKLLKKFGWFPGRGLGRNPKGESEVKFLSKPRLGRLGVGAELPGEAVSTKRAALSVGDRVSVTTGKHVGAVGAIAELEEEYAIVEIGAKQLRLPLLYLSTEVSESLAVQQSARKPLKWVAPGIRVRVVSKVVRDGRLYNLKAVVQDVTGVSTFTLFTDDRELLDDLAEKDIETLIPPLGRDVMVLAADHRGEVGKLVERDKRRNRVVVQLASTPVLLTLTQDEVSELAPSVGN